MTLFYVCYLKQAYAQSSSFINCYVIIFQVIQHKAIRYPTANMPSSQISRHRLKLVKRKVLVLDLDETLIHSHHDGKNQQYMAGVYFRGGHFFKLNFVTDPWMKTSSEGVATFR